MKPYSLRLRLLAGAALWIGLALLLAGTAIVFTFSATVERDLRDDLEVGFRRIIAQIDPGQEPPIAEDVLADARYDVPLGGLYWQVDDLSGRRSYRSRSLWDVELNAPEAASGPAAPLATIAGPDGQTLRAYTRTVQLPSTAGPNAFRVTVAESQAVRTATIDAFRFDIGVALFVVFVALVAAAWLQVLLGLQPLTELRTALIRLRRSSSEARLTADVPSEVQPLVEEVNALLAAQDAALADARARAADLAHGLKTPMAVMRATASRLRANGDEANAAAIDTLCDEMAERVEYNIKLSTLRGNVSARSPGASLDEAVKRSVAVLSKTQHGEQLTWDVAIEQSTSVGLDPHDVMELVGVLLENAGKWARSRVAVTCRRSGDRGELEIVDDGKGLSEAQIAELGTRGKRLDETRSGHGLGLAIAAQIVNRSGGKMRLEPAGPGGGLRVMLSLPAA